MAQLRLSAEMDVKRIAKGVVVGSLSKSAMHSQLHLGGQIIGTDMLAGAHYAPRILMPCPLNAALDTMSYSI